MRRDRRWSAACSPLYGMKIQANAAPQTIKTNDPVETHTTAPDPYYTDSYEGPNPGAGGVGPANAAPYWEPPAPVQVPVGTKIPLDGQPPGSRIYIQNPQLDPSGRITAWAHYDRNGLGVGRGDNVQQRPHGNPDGTVIPPDEPHYHPGNHNFNRGTGKWHVNGFSDDAIPLGPDAPMTPSEIPVDPHSLPTKFQRGFNAAAPNLRPLGRAAMVGGAAYDLYNIATSDNWRETASEVAGGWAGAASFGYAGFALGTAVAGPIGGVIGGIAGGIGGYFAGSRAGRNVYGALQ